MTVEQPIALSIKQPWATLVVAGLKTIEIRRWSTQVRGPVFIHAAKIPDEREFAWAQLPEDWREVSRLGGQLIGMAILTECRTYRTSAHFTEEQQLHRNDPTWFEPPQMYGFVFRDAIPIRPVRASGNVKFFSVNLVQVSE